MQAKQAWLFCILLHELSNQTQTAGYLPHMQKFRCGGERDVKQVMANSMGGR